MTFSDRPAGLTSRTSYLVSELGAVAQRELDRRLARHGSWRTHVEVLAALQERPAHPRGLSRRLALDPTEVAAAVEDLETAGLVTGTETEAGEEPDLVFITSAGREESAALAETAQHASEAVFGHLGVQLHQQLRRILLAYEMQQLKH